MLSHLSSKERLGYTAIAALLLMFAGYVGARHLKQPTPIVISAAAEGSAAGTQVAVDVAGAVKHPGLQRLASGSRVSDAIRSAGGATEAADTSRINLAAPLMDGTQLVVPSRNDTATQVASAYAGGGTKAYEQANVPPSTSAGRAATGQPSTGGLVSLSAGSAKELEAVPGIGPATSARILEYRASHGGFRSVDELLAIKGIGPKKLEQMRRYLRP